MSEEKFCWKGKGFGILTESPNLVLVGGYQYEVSETHHMAFAYVSMAPPPPAVPKKQFEAESVIRRLDLERGRNLERIRRQKTIPSSINLMIKQISPTRKCDLNVYRDQKERPRLFPIRKKNIFSRPWELRTAIARYPGQCSSYKNDSLVYCVLRKFRTHISGYLFVTTRWCLPLLRALAQSRSSFL